MTIVVTGSRRATEQSALISNFGGEPYIVPTVGITVPADDAEVEPLLRALMRGVDYAVFMTATGVRTMMLAAERLGVQDSVLRSLNSSGTTVVARSGKPAGELRRFGVKVDATPPTREEATADGILRLLQARGLTEKSVAILWHGSRNEKVREAILGAGGRDVFEGLSYHYSTVLEPRGADVLGSIGFRYKAPEEEAVIQLIQELVDGSRKIDAITFTSPPAVAGLFEVADEHGLGESLRRVLEVGGHPWDRRVGQARAAEGGGEEEEEQQQVEVTVKKGGDSGSSNSRRIIIVSVGPSTSRELDEHGLHVDVMPDVPAMGAMISALAEHVKSGMRSEGAAGVDRQ
jgi:uroporphyrinogen-III synthase